MKSITTLRCDIPTATIGPEYGARGRTALYLLFVLDGLCDSVLPAEDFDFLLVRPSRRTAEAELAALLEVTLFGAFVWESALPAAVFDLAPVFLLRSVLDALLAALGLVTFDFVIFCSP